MVEAGGIIGVEVAALQGQRAAKGGPFQIQQAADPHAAQPDPLGMYRPLHPGQQVPQRSRAYRPLLTPQLHRGQIERVRPTTIQQLPDLRLGPHLFFQRRVPVRPGELGLRGRLRAWIAGVQ
jgi:hypothetical protein